MPNLVGTGLNQVPTNSMLGGMAYQDPEHASIKDLDLKNLSQINSEIADTAVDVFVYDTRKDSDGGAWRKRTQNTSWYNETLGTATRGTRREFPAVAVIVCTSTTVRIYDGDDPDLPMWIEFVTGGNWSHILVSTSGYIKATEMLNGELVIARNLNTGWQLVKVSFISDTAYAYKNVAHGTGDGQWNGGIVSRNGNGGYTTISTASNIISQYNNDVAMTVLPNAPIDSATGLPIPTIAVATDGGVSVIKDDGSVVDITSTKSVNDVELVHFDKTGRLYFAAQSSSSITDVYHYSRYTIPSADITTNVYADNSDATYYPRDTSGASFQNERPNFNAQYNDGVNEDITHISSNDDGGIVGNVNGLSIFAEDYSTQGNGMVAYAATSYNTGWMHGDCKGAFLSDTDATNLVYTDLLGGKGTFDDASYWTLDSNWSIGSGVATSNGSNGYIYKSGVLTAGARYAITITITSYTSGTLYIYAGTGAPGLLNHYDAVSAAGTFIFTLDAYNTNFGLYSTSFSGSVDNVSVSSVVDQDRSVNAKNLGVFGTVTKTPVATGAELVGYSGFSDSNYLHQPHNSSLEFGTGSFSCTVWFKSSTADTANYKGLVYLNRNGSLGEGFQIILSPSNGIYFYVYGPTNDFPGVNHAGYNDGNWHQISVSSTGTQQKVYLDGVLKETGNITTGSITDTSSELFIGKWYGNTSSPYYWRGSIALCRISSTIPSPEQIKKIYEDEKVLFQENAKCTLYGSSDAVTALAYDDSTSILYAGTSSGRSEFQGLRRINNTTDAVTTAISASNGLVAEQ